MALGHGWGLSQHWDSKVGCLEHKGGSRKDPSALFKRQNKPHDPDAPALTRGVRQRFGSVVAPRSWKEIVTSTAKHQQPPTGAGPRESRGNCRVDYGVLVQSTSPQPQLVTKPPLGTHSCSSAPFAARGIGGWQSPSALGGKDTSPATSWHKWTLWKRKSKWESF